MQLIPVNDSEFIPAFFDDDKKTYKVYNDGGHYIGTIPVTTDGEPKKRLQQKDDIDLFFDDLYNEGIKRGLKATDLIEFIKTGLSATFPAYPDLDSYIECGITRKLHALYQRKKRFRRKAYLNKWTYFVTFTYDSNKMTEDEFRKKLRCALSHLHTRKGWKYMGVFERAPETGRLHFHGLIYVPNGGMIGTINDKRDYSLAQHRMQVTCENSYFAKRFGRNDFRELNAMDLKSGKTLGYILKYISKSGERIVYGRGIPTEILLRLVDDDIITTMQDYCIKYILYDNVVVWDRDIGFYRRR